MMYDGLIGVKLGLVPNSICGWIGISLVGSFVQNKSGVHFLESAAIHVFIVLALSGPPFGSVCYKILIRTYCNFCNLVFC